MKVYKFTPHEPYSGGCIIVAANNKKEVDRLLENIRGYNDYIGPIELPQLTANVDTPQILVNETYFE